MKKVLLSFLFLVSISIPTYGAENDKFPNLGLVAQLVEIKLGSEAYLSLGL